MSPSILLDGAILGLQRVGGVRRIFEQLLLALAVAPGPELLVHVPFKTPFEARVPERVRWVRDWDFRPWRIAQRANALRIRRACRQERVNVYHSLWFADPPCPGLRTAVTICDMAHELQPALRHDEESRRLKKRAIVGADLCIAISEQTKRDIIQVAGIREEKVRVIHLGVTDAFLAPASPDSVAGFRARHHIEGPYWVHVGCRGGYKNFDKAVEGFSRIAADTNGHLVVVGGEDGLGGNAETMLTSSGCSQRVVRLPRVDDLELNAIYSGAAGLVSTSLAEGFGLPLLEAAGSGTLSVVSDIPVYREVLGDSAVFVNPLDACSIAEGMKASLRDDFCSWCKTGARARAAEFTWEKAAAEHVRAYQDLVA